MSDRPGPDQQDLLAREIVRRAAADDPDRSASGPAVASLAVGVVGWIAAGIILLFLLAVAGCIAAYG